MRTKNVLTALAALAASVAPTPAAEPRAADFAVEKVADGVWAFIPGDSKSLVSGNTILIAGEDAALVVDTGHFPSVSRKIAAEIRKLTPKPVRFVVNTHWHYDHVIGNAVFAGEFPGLSIVDQAFTADMIQKKVPGYSALGIGYLTSDIEKIHHALETGKRSNGAAVTDADRETFARRARDEEAVIPEFRAMALRGADVTFEDSVEIRLGRRVVDVKHLGRGNTAGDAIVFVPDAKVLITGDTVVAPVPYSFGSYPTEWVAVLKKMVSMDAATIVPGHGPVMRDVRYLDRVAALLESTVAQVRAAYHPGVSLDEVRKKVDLEKFRAEFAGDDRSRNGMFQESIVTAGVKRAFQEVEGKFAPEGED